MITEDYVSFETAKLLKEKGFDEFCRVFYDCKSPENGYLSDKEYGGFIYNSKGYDEHEIAACPTLQMAMKWLREVHKLHITILWDCGAYIGKNSFYYHIDRMDNYEDRGYNKTGFDSSEEACEAAIKYCLENLI